MPLATALRLCPQGIFVPVDGAKYQRVSREVMTVLRRFTPVPSSRSRSTRPSSTSPVRRRSSVPRRRSPAVIKREVVETTGLTVSVGVATNKLIAKVGSDLRKPDGLVVVEPGEEAAFLAPLEIRRLWGIGPKTAERLHGLGVAERSASWRRCRSRRSCGRSAITEPRFTTGRWASTPTRWSGGGEAAKSVSHETTFAVDVTDPAEIERTLLALTEGVTARLRSAGIRAGTVAVKIRDAHFRTITRQRTLPEPSDLTDTIWRVALELARPETRGKKIRLLGCLGDSAGSPRTDWHVRSRGRKAAASRRRHRRRPAPLRRPPSRARACSSSRTIARSLRARSARLEPSRVRVGR
jgi:DNA polymerase-4